MLSQWLELRISRKLCAMVQKYGGSRRQSIKHKHALVREKISCPSLGAQCSKGLNFTLKSSPMPILYSLVARQKAVLAEFTSSSGNFPTVTRVLLAKIPDSDSKMSYVYDKYVFHYIVDQGITFLCMSDESTKRRITFAFLEDIKKNWREHYTAVERTALPFSLNEAFSPVLRQKLVCVHTPLAFHPHCRTMCA